MNPRVVLIAFLLAVSSVASAQWQIQQSNTSANLRGIHVVDGTVAWASGSGGTVLRTVDGGAHWEMCATPPDGEKLDLRGVWAWDADSALVLSSGPGEASRVFETTDGCRHWRERGRNSDPQGFWDAVVFQKQDYGMLGDKHTGILLGDPVKGQFYTEAMVLGGGWFEDTASCRAKPDEALFAASNSSVFVFGSRRYIVGTGGKGGPRALLSPLLAYNDSGKGCLAVAVPVAGGTESAGIFSLAFRDLNHGIAVGGDYKKPNVATGTAAWTDDGGRHWSAAVKPPRGYRSAVEWSADRKMWIAAGTTGSDISRDDGKTWEALDNGNWNALSLPFVVGPQGRIGKLKAQATK